MVLAKPSWYVGCSPRDPRKLLPELRLLTQYDGKEWTKKDQTSFAKLLAGLDTFEGEGYDKEPGFSTRDRVAKMKTYGFVYVTKENGKDIIHITDAGKAIVASRIPEEVFLKQMLKWQYPSYQHRNEKQYPSTKFCIRPFIFALKLIIALEGITKTELAIFAFTNTDERNSDAVIDGILKYRRERDTLVGKVTKAEFDDAYQTKIFTEAYKEYIKSKTDEEFIAKKMRNAYDMADALTRHLRFTPLFTTKGSRVILSENMRPLAEWIISQQITINPDYDDVTRFYAYMGNPDSPTTILDDKTTLIREIENIHQQTIGLSNTLHIPVSVLPDFDKMSVIKLKELLFDVLNQKKECLRLNLEKDILQEPQRKEIIDMFGRIVNREVIEPATYFEWNMWRALLHIDDEEEIIPNFGMDADLQPTNNAGGKKGDVEAYYKDYNMLIEVTLSSGQRQANTETEPVWRHVGNFQEKGNGKKTFGLFVAPKIDHATPLDFFARASNPLFDGKKVTTIPLTLDQFIDILETTVRLDVNRSKKLCRLWTSLELELTKHTDGTTWWRQFPQIITQWKEEAVA